jgi:hypothetical protein
LSAVTAVAIAWRIAAEPSAFDGSRSPPRWSHANGPAWLYQQEDSLGAVRLRGQLASASAAGNRRAVSVTTPPSWSEMAEASPNVTGLTTKWEEAFGWPMPAMMSRIDRTPSGGFHVVSGINLKRGANVNRPMYLPTRPIWSGIVINAMVFAPAWWVALALLVLSARLLRRIPGFVRKRRGRCPTCGYDLRGKLEDGCSECGWRRSSRTMPST